MRRLFALSLILLCIACAAPKPLRLRGIHGLHLERDREEKELGINLSLDFENPNGAAVHIRNVQVDLYLNGSRIGWLDEARSVRIPRKGKNSLPLEIRTSLSSLATAGLDVVKSWFLGNKAYAVTLDGVIQVRSGCRRRTIPLIWGTNVFGGG